MQLSPDRDRVEGGLAFFSVRDHLANGMALEERVSCPQWRNKDSIVWETKVNEAGEELT